MKILHLISSGGYYGAESVVVNLTKSLARLGHHSTLGLFANEHVPGNDFEHIAAANGLLVEAITCRGRMDWNAVRVIRRLAQERRIDVIHTHGYKADTYALAAFRRIRTPLVATCHNWVLSSTPLRAYQFVDVLCLRRFDMVVAVSAEVAARLRRSGIPAGRITTIPNGIDAAAFSAADGGLRGELQGGNGLLIGMAGRLDANKGQQHLLRCAPEILRQFPRTMFIFVGDGPARSEFENLARQLGVAENVLFLGKRRDMPEVYAAMDIVALPSLAEGMPMTVLEALAARKPVVASAVGDIPVVIRHDDTGLLVKPGDVEGLRDALTRLIAEPELRARLAANGAEAVRTNFSSDAMARCYQHVYEQLRDGASSSLGAA